VNGIARAPTLSSIDSSSSAVGPSLRRRKSTQMPAETNTRSLRSKKPVAMAIDSSLTSISSKVYKYLKDEIVHTTLYIQGSPKEKLSGLPQPSVSVNKRTVHIKVRYLDFETRYWLITNCKVEEQDLEQNLRNGFDSDAESIPLAFTVKV
jgi:hypothetical protein